MRRVLFLCTGNSARSQMAEAILRKLGGENFEVRSAGTDIASEVNPYAIEALREIDAPVGGLHPKKVNRFTNQEFDLVVTVCDNAKQQCPHFPGAKQMLHWSLEDPAAYQGSHFEILTKFRETRDEIESRIREIILKREA
ncbi:arsenate reductase ArsC [Candidatus Thorarchaeota archaeon]|nr:MAG: arsenate reductase ArsC [Candidatus Thorarchaeota archaeon]